MKIKGLSYKPNSRRLLIGEQPNPSKVLLPEDSLSRHRGVKHPRQCVLSPDINLLSLASFLNINSNIFLYLYGLCHHF
jgi:hypothetical protein